MGLITVRHGTLRPALPARKPNLVHTLPNYWGGVDEPLCVWMEDYMFFKERFGDVLRVTTGVVKEVDICKDYITGETYRGKIREEPEKVVWKEIVLEGVTDRDEAELQKYYTFVSVDAEPKEEAFTCSFLFAPDFPDEVAPLIYNISNALNHMGWDILGASEAKLEIRDGEAFLTTEGTYEGKKIRCTLRFARSTPEEITEHFERLVENIASVARAEERIHKVAEKMIEATTGEEVEKAMDEMFRLIDRTVRNRLMGNIEACELR